MSPFEAGQIAHTEGKTEADNPHIVGYTKLGNRKLSEDGIEWENGFRSMVSRVASSKEVAAAQTVEVSRFRKKSNRSYR